MKLALHRSLIFWFGLLVIAFIVSAWVDSNSHGVDLRRRLWSTQFIFVHGQNRVLLMSAAGPAVGVVNESRRSPTPAAKNWGEVFRPFRSRPVESRDPVTNAIESRGWLLSVPHWLMLVAAVVVWLGLLVWRARRRRRGFVGRVS